MADAPLIQNIISGLVSGGTSAATAFLAVFRDIKKRIKALEDKIGDDGSDGDPKTGIFLVVERTDEIARRVKKELDQWEEDPPEWLLRLVNRATRNSSMNLESNSELEHRMDQRFRSAAANISRLEEMMKNGYIERVEYEKDDRERSHELAALREQLAAANGLLRGAMSALGYESHPPIIGSGPPKKRF
jgi:hypothetical protein